MRLALSLLLSACEPAPEDAATLDVKVDHNGKDLAIESLVPRTCTDGGRVYAVWQDDSGEASTVAFNLSDDGGATWLPSDVPLNSGAANATAPDIACAGDNVYVVWEDARDGDLQYRNIYVDVSNDAGRSWLSEELLLDGDVEGEAMSLGPRVVAVDDAAYVAWFDARDGAYDIYLQATTDAGVGWLPASTRVDTDPAGEAYSALPRLAASAGGRVVVAWEDSRSGASDIYVNASEDKGATFAADDQRLDGGDDAGASDSFRPALAMSFGNVYVAWHDERNGDNRDILLNASSDGGLTWYDEAVRADSDAAGQADSLNVALAAVDDRVHLAWQDNRAGGYDIYHRFSRDSGQEWFSAEVRMDTDSSGESQSYAPVIFADGSALLVGWEDRRGDAEEVGFNDLYYNYSTNGGKDWSADDLRINSNAPGTAYAFNLSLARSGDSLVAIWADGRFGTSDIFCASRGIGEESRYLPPEDPVDP